MEASRGIVAALSVSDKTGVPKENVGSVNVRAGWGIEGDAHAGMTHRQVSLLAMESVKHLQLPDGGPVNPGMFAENITTAGFTLSTVQVGDCLRIGLVVLEVTQIGKACHARCAISAMVGDCIMPREGVFTIVRQGGVIRVGDEIAHVTNRSGQIEGKVPCP